MEGKGAQVRIRFTDARKGTLVLDVTDEEGEELGRKGRRQARRGRRPKAAPSSQRRGRRSQPTNFVAPPSAWDTRVAFHRKDDIPQRGHPA